MEQKLKDISESLSRLTVLEINDLVGALEKSWGVSAAPAMAMAVASSGDKPAESAEDEKTEFDVIFQKLSDEKAKINVLKEIRTVTGLGLKEAKDIVEGSNITLKSGISKKDAEAIKKQLEAVGAVIQIS